jgi:hypothetical protein
MISTNPFQSDAAPYIILSILTVLEAQTIFILNRLLEKVHGDSTLKDNWSNVICSLKCHYFLCMTGVIALIFRMFFIYTGVLKESIWYIDIFVIICLFIISCLMVYIAFNSYCTKEHRKNYST